MHTPREIKFISLPSQADLKQNLQGSYTPVPNQEKLLSRYEHAQFGIMTAQRKAAVIAAEIMRPKDFKNVRYEYLDKCRVARVKFEKDCVDIFSELCTQGM